MSLFEDIQSDRKTAFKAKQTTKKEILWFVLAQCKNKKIDLQRDLEDEEVIKLIKKEIKTRREAIIFLEQSGKQDEVVSEKEKIWFLEVYVPKQLSKEQLHDIVNQKIAELNIQDINKEKWKLIWSIMKQYGPQADGRLLQEVLHSYL